MRVKCITELPTKEQARLLGEYYHEGKQEFGLVIGNEYLVFGLSFLGGMPWIEIGPPEHEYLYSVPLCLFDIVNGTVSKCWEIKVRKDDVIFFWPISFYQEYYHDDLFEGVPVAVEDFRRVRKLIEEEDVKNVIKDGE